jgi:hypothetical protein
MAIKSPDVPVVTTSVKSLSATVTADVAHDRLPDPSLVKTLVPATLFAGHVRV